MFCVTPNQMRRLSATFLLLMSSACMHEARRECHGQKNEMEAVAAEGSCAELAHSRRIAPGRPSLCVRSEGMKA